MTARDALVGMKASSKGLTDLCAEHLRQSIRHLQRNCDIECNAHAAAEDWEACKQPDRYDGERMAVALASIPRLIGAVEAVLARLDEWDSYKAWPDAEETQVWYSAGKRHASEAIRALITEALEESQ